MAIRAGCIRGIAILTTALLLVGCGAQASKAPTAPAHVSRTPAAATPASASSHTPSMLSVRVGYCCPSTTVLPVVVGIKEGLFKRAGVNVHFQQFMQGTATVVQALSAGQLDIAEEVGGPDTVLRAAAKGAKIKMISAQETLVPFWIYAKPSIKSLAELRGKTVVFGGLGGPAWTFAVVMLASGGLTPKDVQVIQNGNDGQRLALLLSGRADAAVLNLPENFRAAAKGYHQLAYIGKVVPTTVQVIAASNIAIQRKHEAILRFMRGLQASVSFIKQHTAQAAKIYQAWEKTSPTQARRSVAINAPLYDLNVTDREMIDFFKMDEKVGMWKGPIPSTARLNSYVDFTFLKALGLHS